jgi:hypothetical protein
MPGATSAPVASGTSSLSLMYKASYSCQYSIFKTLASSFTRSPTVAFLVQFP